MKKNLLYLLGVVCMMTSCLGGVETPNPLKGNEITFSASLGGAETKTLYGEGDGKSIKVNWVHNDLITVYGAECTTVPQAEYRVATVTVDAEGNETPVSGQNSASYLAKTGAAGVQWGEKSESDFYAVYPSTAKQFEKTDNGAKVQMNINHIQKNTFEYKEERGCWVGVPYDQNPDNPTMADGIMYAHTTAKVDDNVVNLNFKPWSTVLKFKFEGFNYEIPVGAAYNKVSITKITLQAPSSVEAIAGDFDLEINRDGSASATPYGKVASDDKVDVRKIVIQPDYLPLSANEAVEFAVYTIPSSDPDLYFGTDDDHLWKVKIETGDGRSFTYKMRPKQEQDTKPNLVAGKIHTVTIPRLAIDTPGDLSGSEPNWIEKIPRNVYLSELSLPGAWYCTDANYSGTTDLNDLYEGGVRAFHINCCLNSSKQLVCAGSNGSVTSERVADKLATLNGLVAQHDKEYIAVVLSIAEKADNGSVIPSEVLPKIQEILKSGTLSNLYGVGKDEKGNQEKIDANTTVADVCGKMIVLVNANTDVLPSSYLTGPALIAEASLALDADSSNNIAAGSFMTMQSRPLYWGYNSAGLTYYYHHSQGTSRDESSWKEHPTFANRETAIDDIISQSDDIYLNSTHNGWFMMGIGGYMIYFDNWFGDLLGWVFNEEWLGTTTDVASRLNNYLLVRVEKKLTKMDGFYPSPVGIVLMNDPLNALSNNSKGKELVTAIMNMNAAFPLAADPNRDSSTGEKILDIDAGFADVTPWDDMYLN